MQKINLLKIVILISTIATLSSCMNHLAPRKNSSKANITTLSNEGIICLKKSNQNSLNITYYPLSKSCESSSKIDWKLLGFDTKKDNSNLIINSYALYKRRYPQIATADCAGAGMRTKTISITSNHTIYWGKQKLINTNQISSKICFLKSRNNLKIVKNF